MPLSVLTQSAVRHHCLAAGENNLPIFFENLDNRFIIIVFVLFLLSDIGG